MNHLFNNVGDRKIELHRTTEVGKGETTEGKQHLPSF